MATAGVLCGGVFRLITWQRHRCLVRKEADSQTCIPSLHPPLSLKLRIRLATTVTLCIPGRRSQLQTKPQQVQIIGAAETCHSTADGIVSAAVT